jgi:AraC-like DNA-binding protein
MRGLQSLECDSSSVAARMGTISSMISKTYASHWCARPLARPNEPIAIGGSTADGFAIARAQLIPLSLLHAPKGSCQNPKYYVYTTNQVQILKLEGQKPLYLQPNEIIVLSSSIPLEIVVSRSYTTTALIFESELFRRYIPDPEAIVARRLSYACGLESVLNAMIESAWGISHVDGRERVAPKLILGFLELLSAFSASAPPEERFEARTALDIRRAQVKAYVERHYAEPDTSVASIAQELQVSQRYLQLAFSGDDMTPCAYLRKCRLDACARLLRDPLWSKRNITEIGFACGFNSSAHLSTEFRRSFGVSPREYRRAGARPSS